VSNKPLQIWFDGNGNLLTDAGAYDFMVKQTQTSSRIYKSEEAKDFNDEMEFVKMEDYYRGRARVYLQSLASSRTYSMFISDFNEVILANRFIDNRITGTFHFTKKGAAQTIILVMPKKP
jgi:hypothetical protein